MAPLKLPCPKLDCPFETVLVELVDAKELLADHIKVEHAAVVSPPSTGGAAGCKPDKMTRPAADLGMSETTWRDFEGQWKCYKRATKLTGQDAIDQLIQCCSDSLRLDLRSELGETLYTGTEVDLFKAMKVMAVKESNPMVHRNRMRSIKQGESEQIRNYVARLREAAIDCDFNVTCNCGEETSFTEEMIRDQAVYGLSSQDTQAKILALGSKLLPLKDVIAKAESEEQARLTQAKLVANKPVQSTTSEVAGVKAGAPEDVNSGARCKYCRRPGHGKAPEREVRSSKCPAWNKKCLKCGLLGHFKSSRACKGTTEDKDSGEDRPKVSAVESSDACFSKVKAVKVNVHGVDRGEDNNSKLAHVEWDKVAAHWKHTKPKNMPKLEVSISVLVEEHRKLFPRKFFDPSLTNEKPGRVKRWMVCPDTGAMICISGVALIERLNLSSRDLIPVSQSVIAANESEMDIIGGVILEITVRDEGFEVSTNVLCYISRKCRGTYLSLAACKDLTIVHDKFPAPLGQLAAAVNNLEALKCDPGGDADQIKGEYAKCGCPVRAQPPPLPQGIPEWGGDVKRLKDWILKRYAASAFNVCPHQTLPSMSGPPLHLDVDPAAKPVAIHVPAAVPLHWQGPVKEALDADVEMGVIEPVPPNTPTKWLHRMVLTPKKDGSPRRTVDLSPLNKVSMRHTHHTRSPFHLASSIPPGQKKTTIDSWNGFHSVKLDEESRKLTAFTTPWGVYQYRASPQGHLASGDGYSKRYDEIIKDFGPVAKCIDDVALWDETVEQVFWKTCKYLELCSKNGITFNPTKFQFAQDEVEFLGFDVTNDSVKPSKEMLEAIENFPRPTNITGVRSFFGLINQVSFAFSMSEVMQPFRELLKSSIKFYWDERLQAAFESAKGEIVDKVKEGVKMFDVNKVTCLATDWSKEGVGFFLLQKHCSCPERKPTCCKDGWKLVFAGSRFLKPNEQGWAPVEGEALAVVYSLEKARYYVLGCKDLIIATDHNPLLGIFGDRSLESVDNPRLRKLKEKTLAYRFTMVHIPGKKHSGPDAMSRNPVLREGLLEGVETKAARVAFLAGLRVNEDYEEEDPAKIMAIAAFQSHVSLLAAGLRGIQAVTWERVQHETGVDQVMTTLRQMVQEGFPEEKNNLPDNLKEFYKHRHNLNVCEGVVMYNWDRVVIPRSLRREVMEGLHAGHQCVVGMKARAAHSVFWPGINGAIQDIRDRCLTCNTIAPSQAAEPAITAPPPMYPFQQVCSDYFELNGATYVVMVDRYSGWPSVSYLEPGKANSKTLINTLREWFQLFGVPEECASDGAGTYVSEATKEFFKVWGVKSRVSSRAFAHSNARAELGVKTCKRLIRDNTGPKGTLDTDKFGRALLQYRNTPLQGVGLSPAQILFGRELRDFLPFAPGKAGIRKEWRITADERDLALAKKHSVDLERLNANTKELIPLDIGQQVFCQNQTGNYPRRWEKTGVVIEKGQGPRQYLVRMDGSRRICLINRKFLRKMTAVADIPDPNPNIPDTPVMTQTTSNGSAPIVPVQEDEGHAGHTTREIQTPLQPVVDTPVYQVTEENRQQDVGSEHGQVGTERRYPVRNRQTNVRLKEFELYSLEAPKKYRTGREKGT